jgi:hypothetical protein
VSRSIYAGRIDDFGREELAHKQVGRFARARKRKPNQAGDMVIIENYNLSRRRHGGRLRFFAVAVQNELL